MKREPHTVNGKFVGCYCETDAGATLYLAHRTRAQVYRVKNAWCLDVSLLEKIRARGIETVGVIRREGNLRMVWLTHIDDFFDSPHSFAYTNGTKQRGLPLSQFRVDANKSAKVIEKSVRMR